jgi:phospholipase C
VIFIVWDEWGGYYDHVAPPQVDGLSYGFRVPFIAISPYSVHGTSSDGGSISSTLYSQGSILKFIEDNWSLPSLTPVDAGANDMVGMFDFSGTPNQPLILQPRTCTALTPAQKSLVRGRIRTEPSGFFPRPEPLHVNVVAPHPHAWRQQ